LRFLNDEKELSLRCELIKAFLDDSPPYHALSYTWDVSGEPVDIKLQGKDFSVSQNLYQALLQLRKRFPRTSFWIDAISINQNSIPERNEQVPLMGDIYSIATKVVVWLGLDALGTELAIPFLEAATKLPSIDDPNAYPSIADLAHSNGVPLDRLEELTNGLCHLLGRSWFQRTWIIQEFVLAKADPLMICGAFAFEWEDVIARGALRMSYILSATELEIKSFGLRAKTPLVDQEKVSQLRKTVVYDGGTPRGLDEMRYEFNHPTPRLGLTPRGGMLLDIVVLFSRDSLATDPRDKVFGLLGLMQEADRNAITVDYTKDVVDVYEDFARHYMQRCQSLSFLSIVGGYKRAPDSKLPTWLPDFNGGEFLQQFVLGGPLYHRGAIYCATKDRPISMRVNQRRILSVQGILLDVVSKTVPARITQSDDDYDWKSIFEVFFTAGKRCEICRACNEGNEKPCFQTMYAPDNLNFLMPMTEAIWRTTIADLESGLITQQRTPASPSYGDAFTNQIHGRLQGELSSYSDYFPTTEAKPEDRIAKDLPNRMRQILWRGHCLITDHGWIGVALNVEVGDIVAVMYGGDIPYILRPCENGFEFVGECFVQGVMIGEILEHMEKSDRRGQGFARERWFDII
jgi:hypothetical protein